MAYSRGSDGDYWLRSTEAIPALAEALDISRWTVATYRRQAEQDLNSERVPEALKETIRNYFMALGDGKKGRLE